MTSRQKNAVVSPVPKMLRRLAKTTRLSISFRGEQQLVSKMLLAPLRGDGHLEARHPLGLEQGYTLSRRDRCMCQARGARWRMTILHCYRFVLLGICICI